MNNRLYSYLMTHDSGFAPNPFFGTLTLATCMTDIRRTKAVGQWVAGFAGNALVRKCDALGVSIPHQGLIYLMRIDQILTLDEYFHASRFQQKKPIPLGSNNIKLERGDNIYFYDDRGNYQQLANDNHDEGELNKDTKGRNVLISDHFYYFGRNCPVPETSWRNMGVCIPDRYNRYGSESSQVALEKMSTFLRAQQYKLGVHGNPCIWDDNVNKSVKAVV